MIILNCSYWYNITGFKIPLCCVKMQIQKTSKESKTIQQKPVSTGTAQTRKFHESMRATKERILSILPPDNKLHRVFPKPKPKPASTLKTNETGKKKPEVTVKVGKSPKAQSPDSPTGSSGIFSDQQVDSDYEDEIGKGEGDMLNLSSLHLSSSEDEDGVYDKPKSSRKQKENGAGDGVSTMVKEIRDKIAKKILTLPSEIFKNNGIQPRRGASKKFIAKFQ